MQKKQIIVLTLVAVAIALWFALDVGSYLQFDAIKARMGEFQQYYAENPGSLKARYWPMPG